MGKWRFMRRGAGPVDYPSLGFSATEGDVLDAVSAPDAYWAAADAGAAETVDRYRLPGSALQSVAAFVEDADDTSAATVAAAVDALRDSLIAAGLMAADEA